MGQFSKHIWHAEAKFIDLVTKILWSTFHYKKTKARSLTSHLTQLTTTMLSVNKWEEKNKLSATILKFIFPLGEWISFNQQEAKGLINRKFYKCTQTDFSQNFKITQLQEF